MSFEQQLKEYDFTTKTGTVEEAEIVEIKRNQVIVSLGVKGESLIPKAEFLNSKKEFTHKVGDTILVLVESLDDGEGAFGLSYEKAKNINSWNEIVKAAKENLNITVHVTRATRGGLIISYKGIEGFLPSSLVDVTSTFTEPSQFVNKDIEVKVIKQNEESNSLLVSRKAALMPDQETHEQIFNRLKIGDEVTGTIKNITDYGVFVDLGAVDGLLHITDVDWKRVSNLRSMFSVGQKITLVVSNIDKNSGKISLSRKLLDRSVWENFVAQHKVGDTVSGVVVKTEDYGAFITVEDKIEALVPKDELSWTDKNPSIYAHFEVGQKVSLAITEIEPEKHRVTLSLKRNSENPYSSFERTVKEGDKVKGKVQSVHEFGIFVALNNDLVGLVQSEEVSWVPRQHSKGVLNKFTAGDEVEVTVKKIDSQKEKVYLSMKEQKEDPLLNLGLSKRNEIVDATVVEVTPRQLFVKITEDVYGLVKQSDAGLQKDDKLNDYFKVGDEVRAKVTGVQDRHIVLTLKTM